MAAPGKATVAAPAKISSEESKVESAMVRAQEEQSIDALLADANTAKQLAGLDKWDEKEFEAEASDFWKPEKVGDELKGIYLGYETGERMKSHAFAVLDPKTGKPTPMRFNGTRILSKELRRIEIGSKVWIRFTGVTKTLAGQNLKLFDVKVAKAK